MNRHSPNALVVQHLEAETPDPQIRKDLFDHHGFDPHDAFRFVEDVKAANPETVRRREQHLSAIQQQAARVQRQALVRQNIMKRLRIISAGVAVSGVSLLIIQATVVGLLLLGTLEFLLVALLFVAGPFMVVEGIMD